MTEAASTFSSSVAQPQNFTDHQPANSCINDRFPKSTSLNHSSRENQSDIAQPSAVNVLPNGDSHPLRALCAQLHSQVVAFLDENFKSAHLQAVQAQTRRSLQIIQEALDKYPYFDPFPLPLILSFHPFSLQLYLSYGSLNCFFCRRPNFASLTVSPRCPSPTMVEKIALFSSFSTSRSSPLIHTYHINFPPSISRLHILSLPSKPLSPLPPLPTIWH